MKLGYTILFVEDIKTTLAFSSRQLMTQLNKNPSKADAGAPCFEIALGTNRGLCRGHRWISG